MDTMVVKQASALSPPFDRGVCKARVRHGVALRIIAAKYHEHNSRFG